MDGWQLHPDERWPESHWTGDGLGGGSADGSGFARELLAAAVEVPCGVFLFGQSLEQVSHHLLERNERYRYGLGSLLHPTPPRWVYLPAFRIGRRLVTNAEYLRFLSHGADERGEGGDYEDRHLWEDVWRSAPCEGSVFYRPLGEPGSFFELSEDLSGMTSFVTAYLHSLEREAIVLLSDPEAARTGSWGPGQEVGRLRQVGEETLRFGLSENPLIRRVFEYARSALRHLTGGLGPPRDGAQALRAAQELCHELLRTFGGSHSQALREMDLMAFLSRLEESLRQGADGPLPLRAVLYPRGWQRWQGALHEEARVPWRDRPVTGISVYEALAFCHWLNRNLEDGEGHRFDLPGEVEYERAASWPIRAEVEHDAGVVRLDAREKRLYPWGDERLDFSGLFGGRDPFAHESQYLDLVEKSALSLPGGGALEQLLGFGWQWTGDRFTVGGAQWERFIDARPVAMRYEAGTEEEEGEPVAVYRPLFSSSEAAEFVIRGAPPRVGGQGLTTRRFAAYGLRGYPDLGLRWVARSVPGKSPWGY